MENHHKGIKNYIMIFLVQHCRMIICLLQVKTCSKKQTDISVIVIDDMSQWDVIPKDTVPVVYQCETWLIMSREEHRLRMFENWVLKKISGARREFQETEENFILSSFLTQY